MQMIIQRIWPLANDFLEGPALVNDHPSPRLPSHLCQDPDSISWTFLEQFVLVIFCPFKEGANSGPCLGIRGQDLTPCFACVSTSSSGKDSRLPYPFGLLRKSLVEVFLKN